jgi:hypothetical protein
MHVARDVRVGPDFDGGTVRADARERQGGGDIDVFGESGGGFARGALKDALRFRDAIDTD